MKKHLFFFFLFLFILLFSQQLSAQYNFQYLFAPTNGGPGASIDKTSDGGYVIAGYNQYSTSASQDMVLVKTNSNGTLQWSKKYGSSTQSDQCNSVRQTTDGGYILCGKGSGIYASIIKTSSSGAIQWSAYQANSGLINKISETSDGGFVFAGNRSIGSGAYFFGKINSAGTMLWSYESTSIPAVGTGSSGKVALQAMDKGYFFAGDNYDTTGPANNNWWALFKTDSMGTMQWTKNYSPGKVHDAALTSDSGFVVVGNVGGSIMCAGKFDKNGDVVWNYLYTFGTNADARAVKQTSDGGFILLIYTGTSNNGQLLKLDANGTVLWNKQINAGGVEFTFDAELVIANDGGYVFAANKDNAGFYMGKANSDGTMACNTTTLTATKSAYTITQSAPTYTASPATFTPVNFYSANETITPTTYCTSIPFSLVMSYTNPLCYGDNNGTATATPIGGSGPFNYAWSNLDNTQTIYSLSFGTYSVTVTDGMGATATGTVTLTQPGNLNAFITSNPSGSICVGQCATLTGNISGGTAPYSYYWTPSASTQTIVVCPPGSTNYQLYAIDANSCVSNTANYTKTVTSLPSGNISPVNPSMCYGNGITLTASGGNSYSWWTPVTSASASVIVNPTSTITYSCTATSSAGCTKTYTNTVTVLTTPTVSVTASDTTFCLGGNSVLTATGASTYSWSTGETTSAIFISPSINTTYTVTGNGGNNCYDAASITITVMQGSPPSVGITPSSNPICEGASSTLTASGADTYVWSPGGQTSTSIVVSPTATSSYSLTGTDVGGCSASTSVLLTVNPLPSISASASSYTVCSGNSITMNAAGGNSYSWLPGGITGSAVVVSPTVNTTYTVTGTGGNGCTNTFQLAITSNPLPIISISGNNTICNGTNATLTASGANNYSWNPGGQLTSSIVVSPSSVSTYTANGTDGNGCTGKTTVTVVPIILFASGGSNQTITNCGDSVQLNATANYSSVTYAWNPSIGLSNPNVANPFAYPQTTTTYSLTVSDTCGQVINDAVTVTVINGTAVPICLVTVDTATNTQNVIVWEKPVPQGTIDSVYIYREIGLNNYVRIGGVSYDSLSWFTDTTNGVNPQVTSYRYKISLLDTCGNESALSPHHRTIHLSTPQYTPPNKFDLIWTNDYEGFFFSQYYILRDGNNTGNWIIRDSVTFGNFSYTDITAPSDSARYIVEAVPAQPCSVSIKDPDVFASTIQSSKSNTSDKLNGPVSVSATWLNNSISVYPNPSSGIFVIKSERMISKISITNIIGEKIYSEPFMSAKSEIDFSRHPNGIYFIHITTDKGSTIKKIALTK